jgi:uncharacterized membrane protein YccF (DUF307 family)
MILHPAILALTAASLLITLMVLYSSICAVRILLNWDISSGSELQLQLENSTYLISTIISYFLGFQLVSLFLFIYTADSIHDLFVGAMCAVGSLTVNSFGYPTLLLKVITFILSGLWLIINHADSRGYDYPLIRVKYRLLLVMAPLILAEAALQTVYFLKLRPDIITSCCGSLFSPEARGVATEIANAPAIPMLAVYFGSTFITCAVGAWFYRRGGGGFLFGLTSLGHFMVTLIAVISAVSLYIYAMPAHHCPFCILQGEYHFVGYPIYIALLTAVTTGMGAGWLNRYQDTGSLREVIPRLRRRLTLTSLISTLLLAGISCGYVLFTDFTLR